MEIPLELKGLYTHWNKHTKPVNFNNTVALPAKLEYFIRERMRIWEKKQLKFDPPYTNDAILQKYRFCNIYRELDKQTIQIHTDLKPLQTDFPLWLLNLTFYRFICNPSTNNQVGLLTFDTTQNEKIFNKLKNLPKPKYGSAYIFPISVIQKSHWPTREEFFCFYLPKVIPTLATEIEKFENITVNSALKTLLSHFGFNFKFHWTEILIDVAYQFPEKIDLYSDFSCRPRCDSHCENA